MKKELTEEQMNDELVKQHEKIVSGRMVTCECGYNKKRIGDTRIKKMYIL